MRCLQLMLGAILLKYASTKLFHNPELGCLATLFSMFVCFKIQCLGEETI